MSFTTGAFQAFRVAIETTIGRPSGQNGLPLNVDDMILYDGTTVQVLRTGDHFENQSLDAAIDAGIFIIDPSFAQLKLGPGGDYPTVSAAVAAANDLTAAHVAIQVCPQPGGYVELLPVSITKAITFFSYGDEDSDNYTLDMGFTIDAAVEVWFGYKEFDRSPKPR